MAPSRLGTTIHHLQILTRYMNSRLYYLKSGLPCDLVEELCRSDNKLGLPPRKINPRSTCELSGWASYYGGLDELFRYSNGIPGLMPKFRATWQHGFVEPSRYRRYPRQLLNNIKLDMGYHILTANKEQKELVGLMGYSNVREFGCPFCYAEPNKKARRQTGSMLFMPSHSLDHVLFENLPQVNEYCAYILRESRKYQSSYVSLHLSCLRNNQWWPQLANQHSLFLVAGADHCDLLSLRRMWQIFSQFEFVSTNSLGSHVYYALAAGCKVIVSGPKVEHSFDQLSKDISYVRSCEDGEDWFSDLGYSAEMDALGERISAGLMTRKEALDLLGFNNMLSPAEVRKCLGWSYLRQLLQVPTVFLRGIKIFSKRLWAFLMAVRVKLGSLGALNNSSKSKSLLS